MWADIFDPFVGSFSFCLSACLRLPIHVVILYVHLHFDLFFLGRLKTAWGAVQIINHFADSNVFVQLSSDMCSSKAYQ